MRLSTLAAVTTAFWGQSGVAVAQDGFPDTPANHWAYKALADMKGEGVLVGYPDGLYRGGRPLSRYEMAVGFFRAYTRIKSLEDGLQSQVETLSAGQASAGQDSKRISDGIAQIQGEIDDLKKFAPDIEALKHASETFELQLEQLGVNVEAMRNTLGNLSNRVDKLEKKKLPVDVHGDLNFWAGAGDSREHSYGLDKDGRILGYGGTGPISELFPPVTDPVGSNRDLNILNESAFTFSGTNDKGPKWSGTVVVTDMFGNFGGNPPGVAFGNQSDVFNLTSLNPAAGGLIGYNSGPEDVYIQDASVTMGNAKANVQVGRLGYSLDPYMFRRIDNTSYFSNDRWDNGKYYFDGLLANGKLGPADLTVFGGKNSGLLSAEGVEINPVRSGPIGGFFSPSDPTVASGSLTFDRSLGANLNLDIAKRGFLDLGYILLESDTPTPINLTTNADHLSVYGADGEVRMGSFKLDGGYHKSDIQSDGTTVEGKDNSASNIRLSLHRSFLELFAEYRQIEANYVAPGDWGRLGVLRNPTNIKGLQAGANLKFLKHFTLDAHGDFESGLSNAYAETTYLGSATGIHGYDIRLNYEATHSLNLFAEYENTLIGNLSVPSGYVGSGNPSYRWATLGMGYHFSKTTLFNLQYELDDVNNDYQVSGGGNFHGGFLTSQVTVKF